MCSSFRLICTIECNLWKEYSSILKEGILSGEESGDEVGGDGGGEPDVPVSLCTAATIACAMEID